MYNSNRNKRAKTRDALSKFINGISISDMDSVRTQLGMLSMLSSQTDEISRQTEVILLNLGTRKGLGLLLGRLYYLSYFGII